MNFPCFTEFFNGLFKDFGVTQANTDLVYNKLTKTYEYYNKNSPPGTIESVVGSGLICAGEKIKSFEQELTQVTTYFIVACIVIIIVTSLSIFYVIYTFEYKVLFVFACIIFAVIAFILAFYLAKNAVLEYAQQTRTALNKCYSQSDNDLAKYEQNQTDAILKSMCFYAQLP